MPWGVLAAAVGAGGAIIGGMEQGNAAKSSANAQLQMFNTQQQAEAPYQRAGTDAMSQLEFMLGLGPNKGQSGYGSLNAPFNWQDYMQSPGYQFEKREGMDAITNSAASRGGVFSGNTMKALDEFGTGLAAQDYWQARNAYDSENAQKFQQLYGLTGVGENAAANVGSGAIQTGRGVADSLIQGGNAASATTAGLATSISNLFQNPQLQNWFMNNMGGTLSSGQANDVINQNPFLF